MRIGFYAPLKAPDHPVPSGDRQMARLLLAALRRAGHEVEVISTLRAYLPVPGADAEAARARAARDEVERIADRWERIGAAPDRLFAYHPFYKSPDLVAHPLAQRFGRPYAVAEASHAPKRAGGPWTAGHAAAERAIRAAAVHFCFTANDRAGLAPVATRSRLADLPPFIDGRGFPARAPREPGAVVDLAAVAMMRPGDKAASYALLARALDAVRDRPWRLTVVGDGPARPEVERAFATLPADRVTWRGRLDEAGVADVLGQADLFAWPGVNEAFGLAYLEAQARGLPVVALAGAGTSSTVRHGRTGLLARPDTFAAALDALLTDHARRQGMAVEAARFVHGERTLDRAAAVLDAGLRDATKAAA